MDAISCDGGLRPTTNDSVVIGGRSHPDLVRRICCILDTAPSPVTIRDFSNGETSVVVKETVRDKDVYVVQSSCDNVNGQLMELLIMLHALKIASAKSVTAVLPLFPYSRQSDAATVHKHSSRANIESDKPQELAIQRRAFTFGEDVRNQHRAHFAPVPSREPLSATSLLNPEYNNGQRSWVAQSGSIVASLLAAAGADHIITMDLHDPQFQGFFDVPFDNLLFRPLLIEYIKAVLPTYHSCVIVSPDAGGAKRATSVADRLHTRFALIHQDRRNSATILVGDVSDRVAVLIDDLVDTGATLMRAAQLLKDHGALQVYAVCTHGVFSGDTVYKVRDSAIDCIVTTNSVPQDEHKAVLGDKLNVVDISGLFAEAIRRIRNGESISRLYSHAPDNLG